MDGDRVSSDAGYLLIGQLDKSLAITQHLVRCFNDRRNPDPFNSERTSCVRWSRDPSASTCHTEFQTSVSMVCTGRVHDVKVKVGAIVFCQFEEEREIEKLYKACKSAQERFLIAVLFDSGARATEFHNIRYEDIELPQGPKSYVKLTLKEEYSKTKGRTISLFWKYTEEAAREYLKEREREGIQTTDLVHNGSYTAARLLRAPE